MRHDEWVAADERRYGPEVDYGTTWTDPARPGVQYRVAWNCGKGDLYLATHPAGDDLKVLLVNVDRSTVDGILHGWADQALHGTLRWVRRQTLLAHLNGIGDDPRPPATPSPIEPVAGGVRPDTIDEQPTIHGHLVLDGRSDAPAISDRAADGLVGRHVTVSTVGQTGRTTITSRVSDVDVDGDIELDAMPGHSIPLSTATFLDDPLLAVRRPDGEQRPMRCDAWRTEYPRRHAREQVYGRFWTFDDPADFYSIIWNSGTGELYTYCVADTTVVVRAICDRRDIVEAVLADWPRRQIEACSGYDAVSAIRHASGARPVHGDQAVHRTRPTTNQDPLGAAMRDDNARDIVQLVNTLDARPPAPDRRAEHPTGPSPPPLPSIDGPSL